MLKVLFIGLVWPEPTSSAAGWRILHLVKLLMNNYEVHFASSATRTPYSFDLKSIGVIEHDILLNDSSFDQFISNLTPSVVVFDRFMAEEQYGWRVSENVPNALRILDTEDLHFVRLARQEAFKKGQEINYYSEVAKREIASILRCDLSLIISNVEKILLEEQFRIDENLLFYLPFQEQKLISIDNIKTFEDRQHFVFIGNFIHEPNWRTVEILKRDVWPILSKKIPSTELHIYGAYASEKVFQLHNPKERFFIKGRAEDARVELENYRVLLAPIPFGAGAKGKFVDAMSVGTPSVTTNVGVEDMMFEGNWGGYVCDDMVGFIDKAICLYTNEDIWKDKQKIGYDVFNSTVTDSVYSNKFLNWLIEHSENVDDIRKRNFIGQILQRQELNAAKYMSMWIELKNMKGN